jgi:hypothetical protein
MVLKINILSYIILFTDEYRDVIVSVFLLPHTLKFCLKIPAVTRGVSPSMYYKIDLVINLIIFILYYKYM